MFGGYESCFGLSLDPKFILWGQKSSKAFKSKLYNQASLKQYFQTGSRDTLTVDYDKCLPEIVAQF